MTRSTNRSDRAELVRDVEDRDAESLVQLAEERAERLLRVDVDTGGRLVEDEELRLAGERLRDEGALLLAAGEPLDRRCRVVLEADARDRVRDRVAVGMAERPQEAATRDAAGGHHLAHGRRARRSRAGCAGRDTRSGSGRGRGRRARRRGAPRRVSGSSRPSATRRRVVLPPPFGPAMVTNSPRRISRSTPLRTSGPPGYANETSFSSTASCTRAPPRAREGSRACA